MTRPDTGEVQHRDPHVASDEDLQSTRGSASAPGIATGESARGPRLAHTGSEKVSRLRGRNLAEEVLVSFAGEPGRDDGNLPPVNIVVPDDARELERDVLAYRRELRALRRRQRVTRLFGPFGGREFGGHAAILPLIATIVALSMLAGAMLSVITISPASAPTVPASAGGSAAGSAAQTPQVAGPIPLPAAGVRLDGRTVPARSLVNSVLALVPADCRCGPALRGLALQASAAHLRVYFVASGAAIPQLADLTARYGAGAAKPVYDTGDVLGSASHAAGLTVLVVRGDATAEVHRNLPPGFRIPASARPRAPSGQ
jgi:hypothetical protein